MKVKLLILFIALSSMGYSQNHEKAVANIRTIDEAELYAAQYREVSTSFISIEKDRFLFDEIDTSNLENHVGQTKSLFGRSTKLITDTAIALMDVQWIFFDTTKVSMDMVGMLIGQMEKRIDEGDRYWDLRKKFGHTSATFWSGPEYTSNLEKRFQIDLSLAQKGDRLDLYQEDLKVGFLFVSEASHLVPSFFVISYNTKR